MNLIYLNSFNISLLFNIFLIKDVDFYLNYLVIVLNNKYYSIILSDSIMCYLSQKKIYLFSKKRKNLNLIFKNFVLALFSFFFKYSLLLEVIGIGYKIFLFNNYIYLILGFSHLIKLKLPEKCDIFVHSNDKSINIIHSNKFFLGNLLSIIKKTKKMNIYKGKGIKNVYKKIELKLVKTKNIKRK